MEERKILKTRRRDATSLQRRDRLQRGRDVILLIQKQISLQYNSVCFLYLKNGSFFASILIIFRLIVQTSKHQLYSNRVPHQIQSGTCGLYFREVMILIPNRRSVEIIRMRIQRRWRLLDREEFEHANDGFQGRTLQIQTWESQEIRLNCRFKESWLSLWRNEICTSCVSVCRYGDMRVMMTYELFSMWQNLGKTSCTRLRYLLLHPAAGRWRCCSCTLVCKSFIQLVCRMTEWNSLGLYWWFANSL